MGYMIEISEGKANKLSEHIEESLKHLGKAMQCVSEMTDDGFGFGERKRKYKCKWIYIFIRIIEAGLNSKCVVIQITAIVFNF